MAAQWIIEGEMHYDMFPWDVARFGAWANNPAFVKPRCAMSMHIALPSISPTKNEPPVVRCARACL